MGDFDSLQGYNTAGDAHEPASSDRKGRSHLKKRGSTGRGILIGILLVLIPLCLIGGIYAGWLKQRGYHLMPVNDEQLEVVNKIGILQGLIDEAFIFDFDKETLRDSAYSGYMQGLDDPYSVYYTAEEYESMTESTSGSYYGIGVMIQKDPDTGTVSVVRVFNNTPAKEAGMENGDIILKAAGTEIDGLELEEVVALIKGEEGSEVEIVVYRPSDQKEITMMVERRQVEVDTVTSKMLDDKIGYIELSEFDSVSSEQFKKAIDSLKKEGMTSLVLDLRNNPGGMLGTCIEIADVFVDTGVVLTADNKQGNTTNYEATEKGALSIPTAVLVNGESASASEVLSGCLQDYGLATIVGTQTFGKGIVQSIFPLSDGTAVKLTTAHYFTPNGNDIHKKGVTPDEIIEDDPETKDVDEQLQKAIEILGK
ncbi:MAG: S41 family peptidase [Lachnospiraceae bacterium]